KLLCKSREVHPSNTGTGIPTRQQVVERAWNLVVRRKYLDYRALSVGWKRLEVLFYLVGYFVTVNHVWMALCPSVIRKDQASGPRGGSDVKCTGCGDKPTDTVGNQLLQVPNGVPALAVRDIDDGQTGS